MLMFMSLGLMMASSFAGSRKVAKVDSGIMSGLALSVCLNDGFSEKLCKKAKNYLDCRKSKERKDLKSCLLN